MRKANKFNAAKVELGGKVFDSKHEAKHYQELKLLERAGLIQDLQTQVPFVLIPAQYEETIEYTPKQHKEKHIKKLIEREVNYIADFVYYQDGKMVVEDTKGYKKGSAYAVFVLKRKLMLYVHRIKVKEV